MTQGRAKTQQQEHTWDDLIAAIGQDFSGGEVRQTADAIDRSMIRRYCEPLEIDCPLYHDDEVARQHGYKGILLPWSAYGALSGPPVWKPGDATKWPVPDKDYSATIRPPSERTESKAPPLPMPLTDSSMATDIEIEYLLPVYVGDRLSSRGRKLVSVAVRQTRVGYGAFYVLESEIVNQRGEVVAKTRNGIYQYISGAKGPNKGG
ncbi:MAG: hypothetical protein EXR60_00025 [Dehalococcoidia bacterium]|nr:hypothetical protein [Dehalococcoidia bacterium]